MTTKIPVELSSTPGIVDGSNATAITIDSSENSTFSGDVTITSSTSNKPELKITNTNADANPSYLKFIKDSASPADNDELGRIYMYGDDDAGNSTEAVLIRGIMTDVSNGSEDSTLEFFTQKAGSQTSTLTLASGNVGIGTSPSHPLHIAESADGTKIRLNRGGVCEWDFSIGNTSTLSGVGSGALEILPQNGGTANEFAIGTAGSTAALVHLTTSLNYFQQKIQANAGIYISAFDGDKLITDGSQGGGTDPLFIGNAQIQVSSDERIKKDIVDTAINATEKLKQVRVVDFTWNDPKDQSYNNKNARGQWTGAIAQEMISVFPHIINAPRDKETLEVDNDSDRKWMVEYQNLVPVLIKAIQELEARLKTLEEA